MNERIKALVEQAGYTEGYYASDDGPWIEVEFNKTKFAELIIKECVESIEKTIDTDCDGDSEKMGCEFAITNLKEHFGIE